MPAEFTMQRRVQFSETDMAGVMHFANFFRWMEEVEHAFWRSLGVSVHARDALFSWPRVNASCEYAAPIRFEDTVELAIRVASVGRKSINFEIDFRHDGRRVASGRVTTVCCKLDRSGFTAIPIPDEIRRLLEAASG